MNRNQEEQKSIIQRQVKTFTLTHLHWLKKQIFVKYFEDERQEVKTNIANHSRTYNTENEC